MSRSIEWAPSQLLRLLRGSSGRVGVTGFSSQYCEIKALLDREGPRVVTPAMQQGTDIHQALEEDLMGPAVSFTEYEEEFGPEDFYGVKLGEVVSRWVFLQSWGRAREVPVYGEISGVKLKGIIDEVDTQDGELLLIDTKTHRSQTVVDYKQRLAYHQLLTYHELMRQMLSPKTDVLSLVRENAEGYDFERPLHPELAKVFKWSTLDEMAAAWAQSKAQLVGKPLAPRVRVDFVDRKTHELQSFSFEHDPETAAQLFAFRGELFAGQRQPLPLSRELGSCRYCRHFAQCPKRQS